jgi:hypothetical protein
LLVPEHNFVVRAGFWSLPCCCRSAGVVVDELIGRNRRGRDRWRKTWGTMSPFLAIFPPKKINFLKNKCFDISV